MKRDQKAKMKSIMETAFFGPSIFLSFLSLSFLPYTPKTNKEKGGKLIKQFL
jgi:hypothetical protein